jgi:hypothetical protein
MQIRTFSVAARQLVVPLAVAFVLSIATYALTASNTVPASKAGDGATAVSGYTVSAVHYALNASDPRNIDAVTFTVDTAPPAGATMKVKLVSSGTTFYSCTASGANLTCATTSPQATAATADELTVVIGQ